MYSTQSVISRSHFSGRLVGGKDVAIIFGRRHLFPLFPPFRSLEVRLDCSLAQGSFRGLAVDAATTTDWEVVG